MKIFFDTNVLISAYISDGNCRKIFLHCMSQKYEVLISKQVEKEFVQFLTKKKKFNAADANKGVSNLTQLVHIVLDERLTKPLCRDKDDDSILASALTAGVDCILSGDKDLLVLKKIRKISIVYPSDFWRFESLFKK